MTDPVAIVEPTSAPSIADGVERPLDPRVVLQARVALAIVTTVTSGLVLLAVAVGWLFLSFPVALVPLLLGGWMVFTGTLAWLSYRWPAVAYRYTLYTVDMRAIQIRRGVFWRKVIDVPRTRVQHTDVSQGPVQRRYGLGTLVIYTAGTDFARVDLSGLDHGTALRIRDHLLPGDGNDAV